AWPEAKRREHALGKITGHEFCRALEKARGSDKAASLALKKAGIPGLRYWDGASRTEREGTHNYVIWDEGKITIKEANGMPIAPGETEIKFALAPEIAKAELREGRRGVSIPPENLVPPWRPKGWYRGVRRWLDRKFFDRSAELKEFSKLAAALRGLEGIDETDSNDPFNIVTARRLTAEGRIKEMILNGTLDAFGNRTGASLASVFAGLDKAGMEAFLKYAKYRLLAMRRGGDWRMWAAEEGIPTDDVRVDPARLEELEGWARRVVEHFSSAFPQEAGRIEAALGLSEEQPREPGVERVEFPALLALSFMSDSPLPLLGEDGGLGYRLQGSEFRVKNVLEQSVIQAVRTLFNARQLAAREAEREVTPAELNGMFDEAAAFVEGLANGEFADIYAGLSEVEIGDLAEYLYGLRAIALLRDAKTGRRNPGISRRKAEQLRKRHESEDFKRRAERVWSFHADFG
ncbi:MAG: hypothetical protein LBR12_00690, partial [Opitutaceae bacterium]|nr:hypothetical protein [Opitutaceae bacterium]